ncbi:class I SAM-dependent methyltransferase [Microbacterium sp. NPDC089696]|uniref:class I SAM-dependent methyltransferase n=1 Tax=Microbacterium sp. NPDC089696 TaxID=3364199 RepID=UPI0038288F08
MGDRIDRIRQAFDARAGSYDDSEMHRSLAEALAATLPLDGASTVVDIATGTGLVLRALADRAAEVDARLIGVDVSSGMLEVARRELPGAEWIEADAARLPLADMSADAVLCVTALHIIPDVPAALHEWRRILRPGGRLVTATFCSPHLSGVPDPSASQPYPRDHQPYASIDAIAQRFAPAGFDLDDQGEWSDGVDTVLIAGFHRI